MPTHMVTEHAKSIFACLRVAGFKADEFRSDRGNDGSDGSGAGAAQNEDVVEEDKLLAWMRMLSGYSASRADRLPTAIASICFWRHSKNSQPFQTFRLCSERCLLCSPTPLTIRGAKPGRAPRSTTGSRCVICRKRLISLSACSARMVMHSSSDPTSRVRIGAMHWSARAVGAL
jgi:hypothetical protein